MSKKTVTLYKPDGSTYTLYNVKSAYKHEHGTVYIQPSDDDHAEWGKTIQTDLQFLLVETD